MGRYKDAWFDAYVEIGQELMDENPTMTEEEADELAADSAHDRVIDNITTKADMAHERERERL